MIQTSNIEVSSSPQMFLKKAQQLLVMQILTGAIADMILPLIIMNLRLTAIGQQSCLKPAGHRHIPNLVLRAMAEKQRATIALNLDGCRRFQIL